MHPMQVIKKNTRRRPIHMPKNKVLSRQRLPKPMHNGACSTRYLGRATYVGALQQNTRPKKKRVKNIYQHCIVSNRIASGRSDIS
jgi:hypothetical protein